MSIAEITAGPAGVKRWLPAIEASVDSPVEIVETALSWVLLTDRHAYKIKKPVDIGEARYRSSVRRSQACIDEVWLNRRLAPDVYLGVAPVARGADGALRLGGKGAAVEWAVKMRRLRGDRNLLWLITHGELSQEHVVVLANLLANFYLGSPPESHVLDDLCSQLRRRIEDDTIVKGRLSASMHQGLRQIRLAQAKFLNHARMVLNLRVCDGRIVDGHGDLRPEHVFLERQPAIIDCVEYSPARRKIDALDDLCGLTMECLRLGRADVAEILASTYRSRTGDESFADLEAFYRSLHACSRAIAALGGDDDARRDGNCYDLAGDYLEQAHRECEIFG